MTATAASRFGFPGAIAAAEATLVSGARLQPRPIPAGLALVDGAWRGQTMRWRARAYTGPSIAYARVVTLTGGEVEIANLFCVPRPTRALPLLGVDLVVVAAARGGLVAADLSPPPGVNAPVPDEVEHARATLTPAGELPAWAQRCFSPAPLFARIEGPDDVGRATAAVGALARTFVDLAAQARTDDDLVALRARLAWTRSVLDAHRTEDRTLDLLARMFPPSIAQRLVDEVLFPDPFAFPA